MKCYFRYSAALVSKRITSCRSCHLVKKLSATLKVFLFQTSKTDESVLLVLQILKPETIVFLVFFVPLDRVSSTEGWWEYPRVISCQTIQYFWVLTPLPLRLCSFFHYLQIMLKWWVPENFRPQTLTTPKLLRFEKFDRTGCSAAKPAILNVRFL